MPGYDWRVYRCQAAGCGRSRREIFSRTGDGPPKRGPLGEQVGSPNEARQQDNRVDVDTEHQVNPSGPLKMRVVR